MNTPSMTIPICIFILFLTPYTWWPFVISLLVIYITRITRITRIAGTGTNAGIIYKESNSDPWLEIERYLQEKHDLGTHKYWKQYDIQVPTRIKYIQRDDMLAKHVLHLWNNCKKYHVYGCIDIIVRLENFMRIHFHTMLGLYDVQSHVPLLYDLQDDIDACFSEIVINVPYHVQNKIVSTVQQHTSNILSQYMKIMQNKYTKSYEYVFAFAPS
jgi:hypothetical protein